jgi:hypothetical protein
VIIANSNCTNNESFFGARRRADVVGSGFSFLAFNTNDQGQLQILNASIGTPPVLINMTLDTLSSDIEVWSAFGYNSATSLTYVTDNVPGEVGYYDMLYVKDLYDGPISWENFSFGSTTVSGQRFLLGENTTAVVRYPHTHGPRLTLLSSQTIV